MEDGNVVALIIRMLNDICLGELWSAKNTHAFMRVAGVNSIWHKSITLFMKNVTRAPIGIGQSVWAVSDTQPIFTEHVRSCLALALVNADTGRCALAHISDRFLFDFAYRLGALAESITEDVSTLSEHDHSVTALVYAMCDAVPGGSFVLAGGIKNQQYIEDATTKLYIALWIDLVEREGMTDLVIALVKKYNTLQFSGMGGFPFDPELQQLFSNNPVPCMESKGAFSVSSINRVITLVVKKNPLFNTSLFVCILQGGLMCTSIPDFTKLQSVFMQSILFTHEFIPFCSNGRPDTSKYLANEIVIAATSRGFDIEDKSCTYITGTQMSGISMSVFPDGTINTWSDSIKIPLNTLANIPANLIGSRKGFMHKIVGRHIVGSWDCEY